MAQSRSRGEVQGVTRCDVRVSCLQVSCLSRLARFVRLAALKELTSRRCADVEEEEAQCRG